MPRTVCVGKTLRHAPFGAPLRKKRGTHTAGLTEHCIATHQRWSTASLTLVGALGLREFWSLHLALDVPMSPTESFGGLAGLKAMCRALSEVSTLAMSAWGWSLVRRCTELMDGNAKTSVFCRINLILVCLDGALACISVAYSNRSAIKVFPQLTDNSEGRRLRLAT